MIDRLDFICLICLMLAVATMRDTESTVGGLCYLIRFNASRYNVDDDVV